MLGGIRSGAAANEKSAAAAFIARAIGPILATCGAVGLLASFVLAVEKLRIVEDPSYIPTCSINPVLSCGSVMTTVQAEAFGFPNPLLGIAGFAAVLAIGLVLVSGAEMPRWLWLMVLAGLTFATVFVHWLIFQSLYRIEALCPYCMVVWVVTVVSFLYCLLHSFAAGYLPVPATARKVVRAAVSYHGVILTCWLAAVTVLIGEAFWSYWRTLA